jgi:hypothetical protein
MAGNIPDALHDENEFGERGQQNLDDLSFLSSAVVWPQRLTAGFDAEPSEQ